MFSKSYTARKLGYEKRSQMFEMFCSGASTREISQSLNLSLGVVKVVMRMDDWEVRREKVEKLTNDKVDKKIVSNRRLRNVQVLDLAIDKIYEALADGSEKPEVRSLAKLVVAQDVLIARGAADEPSVLITEEVQQAINLLGSLGADGLKKLADSLTVDGFLPEPSIDSDRLLPEPDDVRDVARKIIKDKPLKQPDVNKLYGAAKRRRIAKLQKAAMDLHTHKR